MSQTVGLITLEMFFALLAGLPALRGMTGSTGVALFDAFYCSGALVFGGGHGARLNQGLDTPTFSCPVRAIFSGIAEATHAAGSARCED
ncbi:hypothetical protein [Bradyrhizobium centrolobii]|uniref:hypothetical protein n=1 Tax=Bradyrhizobium centrolobii TaxID=1505087 RepID=UPI000AE779F1|nr:hypothetical protein [Bradyrhizobium centrolobii]